VKCADWARDSNMLNAHEYASIEGSADNFLTSPTVTYPLVQRIRGRFVTHGTT